MEMATALSVFCADNVSNAVFLTASPCYTKPQSIPAGEGLTARYCLSDDIFSWGAVCEGRTLAAMLCKQGDPVPIAVLEALSSRKAAVVDWGF